MWDTPIKNTNVAKPHRFSKEDRYVRKFPFCGQSPNSSPHARGIINNKTCHHQVPPQIGVPPAKRSCRHS